MTTEDKKTTQSTEENCYQLGLFHQAHNNIELAITYYLRAPSHPGAKTQLGYLHMHGIGVKINEALAIEYLTAAALGDDVDAMKLLSRLGSNESFLSAEGQEKMKQWAKQASALGKETFELGDFIAKKTLSHEIRISEPFRSQELERIKQAAQKNVPAAKYQLGLYSLNGVLLPKDINEGIRLLREAQAHNPPFIPALIAEAIYWLYGNEEYHGGPSLWLAQEMLEMAIHCLKNYKSDYSDLDIYLYLGKAYFYLAECRTQIGFGKLDEIGLGKAVTYGNDHAMASLATFYFGQKRLDALREKRMLQLYYRAAYLGNVDGLTGLTACKDFKKILNKIPKFTAANFKPEERAPSSEQKDFTREKKENNKFPQEQKLSNIDFSIAKHLSQGNQNPATEIDVTWAEVYFTLGLFYETCRYPNLELAFHYYSLALDAYPDYHQPKRQLGYLYWHGLGVTQDFTQAFKNMSVAADRGDMQAQKYLSLFYYRGIGVEESVAEAKAWAERAQAQEEAAFGYAVGGFISRKMPIDFDKLPGVVQKLWIEKIEKINKNYFVDHLTVPPQELYQLAVHALTGKGLEKDIAKAQVCLEAAAKINYPPAQLALNLFYLEHIAYPENIMRAQEGLKDINDKGICTATAHFYLGVIADDPNIAVTHYVKAAKLNPLAMLQLARHYANKNYSYNEGACTQHAADQGSLFAEAANSLCQLTGRGMPEDQKTAVLRLVKIAKNYPPAFVILFDIRRDKYGLLAKSYLSHLETQPKIKEVKSSPTKTSDKFYLIDYKTKENIASWRCNLGLDVTLQSNKSLIAFAIDETRHQAHLFFESLSISRELSQGVFFLSEDSAGLKISKMNPITFQFQPDSMSYWVISNFNLIKVIRGILSNDRRQIPDHCDQWLSDYLNEKLGLPHNVVSEFKRNIVSVKTPVEFKARPTDSPIDKKMPEATPIHSALFSQIESTADPEQARAFFLLGSFLESYGPFSDKQAAMDYYRKAYLLGDPEAQIHFAYGLLHGIGIKQDQQEAFMLISMLSQGQDELAQYAQQLISLCCFEGWGLPAPDTELAKFWAEVSSKPDEQYNAGDFLAKRRSAKISQPSEGIKVLWMKEVEQLQKLILSSDQQIAAKAKYQLAQHTLYAVGTAANKKESFKLLKEAADSDYPPAQAAFGVCYFMGIFTAKNQDHSDELAISYFKKAANNGDAQYYLGECCRLKRGKFADNDFSKDMKNYYEAAAKKMNIKAFLQLAAYYYNQKDLYKAAIYNKQAAKLGSVMGESSHAICLLTQAKSTEEGLKRLLTV